MMSDLNERMSRKRMLYFLLIAIKKFFSILFDIASKATGKN